MYDVHTHTQNLQNRDLLQMPRSVVKLSTWENALSYKLPGGSRYLKTLEQFRPIRFPNSLAYPRRAYNSDPLQISPTEIAQFNVRIRFVTRKPAYLSPNPPMPIICYENCVLNVSERRTKMPNRSSKASFGREKSALKRAMENRLG